MATSDATRWSPAATLGLATILAAWLSPAMAGVLSVEQLNLVSNDTTIHPASLQDASLKNAWGVSYGPGNPFWVSANGSGLAIVYSVSPTDVVSKPGLEVTIQSFPPGGTGNPTGQVFNTGASAGAFNGDAFLFVSEDGTVSGWRDALGTNAEVLVTGDPANIYKGAALATISGHTYLYAANFSAGKVDVFKGDSFAPDLAGNFTDPNLPSGFSPFNIQNLGGTLYVTYAKQEPNNPDDVPGPGNGFVDAFNTDGTLIGRIASDDTLNSPWGLAIAPASFGAIAGDLLVGNFGDGRINVFDLGNSNMFVGQLQAAGGGPLEIGGLWALSVGNGGAGGSLNELYFSAGPDQEANGLFGALRPIGAVSEPGTLALVAASLLGVVLASRRSRGLGR